MDILSIIPAKEISDVLQYVSTKKTLSCSDLQQKFIKGYNWAGRIMDFLEDKKLVGPFEGSRSRNVIGSISMFVEIKNQLK